MSMTYDECAEQDYWNRFWERVCPSCPAAGDEEWCARCRESMMMGDEEDEKENEDDEGEDWC